MSLNGLDGLAVNDAYQAAIGENGGWFVLKYITRDEVGLLKSGSGGLVELKEAIEKYEEKSPLFGLIHFRRKNALLKYVPEGTSRLLQARLAVHLQAIVEKFTHDTIVSFNGLPELTENNLSSAISLVKPSTSVKSAKASRRPLTEIVEDAGEILPGNTIEGGERQDKEEGNTETIGEGVKSDTIKETLDRLNGLSPPFRDATKHIVPKIREVHLQPEKEEVSERRRPHTDRDPVDEKAATSRLAQEEEFERKLSLDRRASSQSARPATRDLYGESASKTKAKVGPRPSMEYSRHRTSTSISELGDAGPVASLPKGLRMPPRKVQVIRPQQMVRPQTQQGYASPRFGQDGRFTPLPLTPASLHGASTERPSSRAGSVVSVPSYLHYPEPKSPTTTPEKMRLMKALQLRKKSLAERTKPEEVSPTESLEDPVVPTSHPVFRPVFDTADPSPIRADSDVTNTASPKHDHFTNADTDVMAASVPDLSDGPSIQSSEGSKDDPMITPILMSVLNGQQGHASIPLERKATKNDEKHSESVDLKSFPLANGSSVRVVETCEDQLNGQAAISDARIQFSDYNPLTETQDQIKLSARTDSETTHLEQHKETPVEPPAQPSDMKISENYDKKRHDLENNGDGNKELLPASNSISLPVKEPSPLEPRPTKTPALDSESLLPHRVPLPRFDSGEERELISLAELKSGLGEAPSQTLLFRSSNGKLLVDSHNGAPINPDRVAISWTAATATVDEEKPDTKHRKRGNIVEPIRIVSNSEISDDNISLNDSLMEELHSATVQQARPVFVSKSPATPVFPTSVKTIHSKPSTEALNEALKLSRTPSIPLEVPVARQQTPPFTAGKSDTSPAKPSPATIRLSRTGSRAGSNPPDNDIAGRLSPQASVPFPPLRSSSRSPAPMGTPDSASGSLSKKGGVSSLISQRIKALEKYSTTPNPQQVPSSAMAALPSLVRSRKNSLSTLPGAFSTPPETASSNRRWGSRSEAPYPSPSPSPQTQGNIISRAFGFKNSVASPKNSQSQSITVTSKIVRDPSKPEVTKYPSEPTVLNLQRSPQEISYQESNGVLSSKSPNKLSKTLFSRSSTSLSKDNRSISDTHSSRASISSRKASSDTVRPLSPQSSEGRGSNDGKNDKKESKKSRIMKRMSTMSFSSPRRNPNRMSPSKEESIPERQEPEPVPVLPTSLEIGELNIQFPDTLLWKRRHMTVDGQGFLTLTPAKSDMNSRVGMKRYHLSEFRPPYIPDQDRQELPNSVILDFNDGANLQCACESPSTQARVLQSLFEAFRNNL